MEKTEYFVYCGFFITHYWVERFAQIPKGVFLEVPTNLTQRNDRNGIVEITIEAYNQNNDLVLTDVTDAIVKCRDEKKRC